MLKRNIAIIFGVFTVVVNAYAGFSDMTVRYPYDNYATTAQLKIKESPNNGHWHRAAKNIEDQIKDFSGAKIFNVEHAFPKIAATGLLIVVAGGIVCYVRNRTLKIRKLEKRIDEVLFELRKKRNNH